MDVDPLASMRCWAVDIELAGRTFEIPAMPAADWWPVLVSADLTKVLDFVVSTPTDSLNFDDLLLDGTLTADDLGEALKDVVEEVTGRSLHVSIVLAMVAAQGWTTVGGDLARRGFRWDLQPIGAALDAIHYTLVNSMTEENQKKFQSALDNESLTSGKKRKPDRGKVLGEFEAIAGPRPTAGAISTGGPSEGSRPRTRTRPRPPRQGGRSTEPRPRPAPPG